MVFQLLIMGIAMAPPELKLDIDIEQRGHNPTGKNGSIIGKDGEVRVRAPAVSNKKKWVPAKWESLFDEWVLRSVLGASNNDIAEKYHYSRQHVSAVLNTPQAKLLRRQLHDNLRKSIELKTEERIAHLQDKALLRMTQLVDDDDLAAAQPFAMFDRSVVILKGTGVLKSDEKGGGIN